MSKDMRSATLVLALLIPMAATQQQFLKFVAQLSVSGCAIFVQDTGAPNGPHLVVEPLMCVTESLHDALPRYDPLTQQSYVSVKVMLSDDAMLAEAKLQLQHLSPKSVVFATMNLTDISASTDDSSPIKALGFDWTPGDATGILRLGCSLHPLSGNGCCINCSVTNFITSLENRQPNIFAFLGLLLTTQFNESVSRPQYKLVTKTQRFFDQNAAAERYGFMPCSRLEFIRSIRSKNCTAHVYRKSENCFLIEPLMCFDAASMTKRSVMYDYSRAMHYLKLDIVLQDDEVLNQVVSQLGISRRFLAFLRVWRSRIQVTDALSCRFGFSDLMVSGDWRSGQVRVYCRSESDCNTLRDEIQTNSFRFLRHIKWSLTSLVEDTCTLTSPFPKYLFGAPVSLSSDYGLRRIWMDSCQTIKFANPKLSQCLFSKQLDGRKFVVIQQRISGTVSFGKEWNEYVNGFGDENNFWIGLETISLLSSNGATLRVEMKLWNGTDFFAEYSGFKVGNLGSKYRMTYHAMINGNLSSVMADSMLDQNDAPFVTSLTLGGKKTSDLGEAGWWFSDLRENRFNPNGLYPQSEFPKPNGSIRYITWDGAHLREIRLMLQI